MSNTGMWPLFEEYSSAMVHFFEIIYREGIQWGEFHEHDARSRAVSYYSALNGITATLAMSKDISVEKPAHSFEQVFIKEIQIDNNDRK